MDKQKTVVVGKKMGIKMLTEDKVDKFLKQGYIHLKNVIDPIKLAETNKPDSVTSTP